MRWHWGIVGLAVIACGVASRWESELPPGVMGLAGAGLAGLVIWEAKQKRGGRDKPSSTSG